MSDRVCFEFRVKLDMLPEYLHRHAPVSPDMLAALHDAGIRNYSLFHAGEGRIIGVYESDDLAVTNARLRDSEAARRWDREMRPFFVASDEAADDVSHSLVEVFHLQTQYDAATA